jgi:hypothetical protein
MNVALANVTLAVVILIDMKAVLTLNVGMGAGRSLPMVVLIVCPISLKGMVVADVVLTNVALAVLIRVVMIFKAVLDLAVLTGGRVPVACSIGIPLLAEGMLTGLLTGSKSEKHSQNESENKY